MRQSCIYAFDLDGTLLRGTSSIGFYRYALRRGVFSYKTLPSCFFLVFCFLTFFDLSSFYFRIVSSFLVKVSFSALVSVGRDVA